MSLEVKPLMEDKPIHWTGLALCGGDDRFTGNFGDISPKDHCEMIALCGNCPVFDQCAEWAERDKAIEVFAAGSWRYDRWWEG